MILLLFTFRSGNPTDARKEDSELTIIRSDTKQKTSTGNRSVIVKLQFTDIVPEKQTHSYMNCYCLHSDRGSQQTHARRIVSSPLLLGRTQSKRPAPATGQSLKLQFTGYSSKETDAFIYEFVIVYINIQVAEASTVNK